MDCLTPFEDIDIDILPDFTKELEMLDFIDQLGTISLVDCPVESQIIDEIDVDATFEELYATYVLDDHDTASSPSISKPDGPNPVIALSMGSPSQPPFPETVFHEPSDENLSAYPADVEPIQYNLASDSVLPLGLDLDFNNNVKLPMQYNGTSQHQSMSTDQSTTYCTDWELQKDLNANSQTISPYRHNDTEMSNYDISEHNVRQILQELGILPASEDRQETAYENIDLGQEIDPAMYDFLTEIARSLYPTLETSKTPPITLADSFDATAYLDNLLYSPSPPPQAPSPSYSITPTVASFPPVAFEPSLYVHAQDDVTSMQDIIQPDIPYQLLGLPSMIPVMPVSYPANLSPSYPFPFFSLFFPTDQDPSPAADVPSDPCPCPCPSQPEQTEKANTELIIYNQTIEVMSPPRTDEEDEDPAALALRPDLVTMPIPDSPDSDDRDPSPSPPPSPVLSPATPPPIGEASPAALAEYAAKTAQLRSKQLSRIPGRKSPVIIAVSYNNNGEPLPLGRKRKSPHERSPVRSMDRLMEYVKDGRCTLCKHKMKKWREDRALEHLLSVHIFQLVKNMRVYEPTFLEKIPGGLVVTETQFKYVRKHVNELKCKLCKYTTCLVNRDLDIKNHLLAKHGKELASVRRKELKRRRALEPDPWEWYNYHDKVLFYFPRV